MLKRALSRKPENLLPAATKHLVLILFFGAFFSMAATAFADTLTIIKDVDIRGNLSTSTNLTMSNLFATTALKIPNGAGGTTVSQAGHITVDSTSGTLNFYNGSAERVLTPIQSKSITVESPTSSEDISLFYTDDAITITKMVCVMVGSSPSVTWTVRHHTDRSNAGNEVVTSGTTTTSTTTGSVVTSFNDATVVADSFLWLETTAQSGTVTNMNLTVFYTQDP